MLITISHLETTFNRATRKKETREIVDGRVSLPSKLEIALRRCAKDYRCSSADMVSLVLSYYFGDGANHYNCEWCDFWRDCCQIPDQGEQATLPLLDKGSVVVGLPSAEQGF